MRIFSHIQKLSISLTHLDKKITNMLYLKIDFHITYMNIFKDLDGAMKKTAKKP